MSASAPTHLRCALHGRGFAHCLHCARRGDDAPSSCKKKARVAHNATLSMHSTWTCCVFVQRGAIDALTVQARMCLASDPEHTSTRYAYSLYERSSKGSLYPSVHLHHWGCARQGRALHARHLRRGARIDMTIVCLRTRSLTRHGLRARRSRCSACTCGRYGLTRVTARSASCSWKFARGAAVGRALCDSARGVVVFAHCARTLVSVLCVCVCVCLAARPIGRRRALAIAALRVRNDRAQVARATLAVRHS